MKSKAQKIEELKKIKENLPRSKMVIFTTFSGTHSVGPGQTTGDKGLSVSQMTALKRLLRSLSSEYFVTKKTLIDMALKDKSYDGLNVYAIEGSIGLVFGGADSYGVAKSVYDFSKKNPALHFWGAIVDGKFIDTSAFLEIAKMPSREVLINQLVGILTYPVRGLAVVLSEVAKNKGATS